MSTAPADREKGSESMRASSGIETSRGSGRERMRHISENSAERTITLSPCVLLVPLSACARRSIGPVFCMLFLSFRISVYTGIIFHVKLFYNYIICLVFCKQILSDFLIFSFHLKFRRENRRIFREKHAELKKVFLPSQFVHDAFTKKE